VTERGGGRAEGPRFPDVYRCAHSGKECWKRKGRYPSSARKEGPEKGLEEGRGGREGGLRGNLEAAREERAIKSFLTKDTGVR